MAEVKISVDTSEIIRSAAPSNKMTYGTPQTDISTIESTSDVVSTDTYPEALQIVSFGNAYGHFKIELYDKNDSLADSIEGKFVSSGASRTPRMYLWAKDGQAAGLKEEDEVNLHFWVDVASYATGKVVYEATGHFTTFFVIDYVKTGARNIQTRGYLQQTSGKAHNDITVPFTVEAVA
jgi:hypothetical protein